MSFTKKSIVKKISKLIYERQNGLNEKFLIEDDKNLINYKEVDFETYPNKKNLEGLHLIRLNENSTCNRFYELAQYKLRKTGLRFDKVGLEPFESYFRNKVSLGFFIKEGNPTRSFLYLDIINIKDMKKEDIGHEQYDNVISYSKIRKFFNNLNITISSKETFLSWWVGENEIKSIFLPRQQIEFDFSEKTIDQKKILLF